LLPKKTVRQLWYASQKSLRRNDHLKFKNLQTQIKDASKKASDRFSSGWLVRLELIGRKVLLTFFLDKYMPRRDCFEQTALTTFTHISLSLVLSEVTHALLFMLSHSHAHTLRHGHPLSLSLTWTSHTYIHSHTLSFTHTHAPQTWASALSLFHVDQPHTNILSHTLLRTHASQTLTYTHTLTLARHTHTHTSETSVSFLT